MTFTFLTAGPSDLEQGRRDHCRGAAQDPEQPRLERLPPHGEHGAAHHVRRLVLVAALQEGRAAEVAQGAGDLAAQRRQGGHRQEGREQDRHGQEVRGEST